MRGKQRNTNQRQNLTGHTETEAALQSNDKATAQRTLKKHFLFYLETKNSLTAYMQNINMSNTF